MLTGSGTYRSCNNTGSVKDVMPRLDSQVHAYERNTREAPAQGAVAAAARSGLPQDSSSAAGCCCT